MDALAIIYLLLILISMRLSDVVLDPRIFLIVPPYDAILVMEMHLQWK